MMGTNIWISCMTGELIGIIKKYNEISKKWEYYIGVGKGKCIDEDIDRIVAYGQKFESLEILTNFLGCGSCDND